MSIGVLLNFALAAALLACGQWLVLKLFIKNTKYFPLFGSLFLVSVIASLLKGLLK